MSSSERRRGRAIGSFAAMAVAAGTVGGKVGWANTASDAGQGFACVPDSASTSVSVFDSISAGFSSDAHVVASTNVFNTNNCTGEGYPKAAGTMSIKAQTYTNSGSGWVICNNSGARYNGPSTATVGYSQNLNCGTARFYQVAATGSIKYGGTWVDKATPVASEYIS